MSSVYIKSLNTSHVSVTELQTQAIGQQVPRLNTSHVSVTVLLL